MNGGKQKVLVRKVVLCSNSSLTTLSRDLKKDTGQQMTEGGIDLETLIYDISRRSWCTCTHPQSSSCFSNAAPPKLGQWWQELPVVLYFFLKNGESPTPPPTNFFFFQNPRSQKKFVELVNDL